MSGAEDVDAVHGSPGISRRELIARSVVAGGLVWAAPTLMSATAGAQTPACPCIGGVQTTVKIASSTSANCGVACLDHVDPFQNYPCLDDLVGCLLESDPNDPYIEYQELVNGQARKGRIILRGGITLLAAAMKNDSECFFAYCSDGFCPNKREYNPPGKGTLTETLPVGQERIRVCPGGSSGGACVPTSLGTQNCEQTDPLVTEILFDSLGEPVNHIELALCIPNALTGQCP